MSSIWDWSATASSNGNADATINYSEGQTPSSLNDSARALMARVSQLLLSLGCTVTTGGTANAQTLADPTGFSTLRNGLVVGFTASTANTGPMTLDVNGAGAKAVYAKGAALVGGEIVANGQYVAVYNTALASSGGAWHLITPRAASAGANSDITSIAGLTTALSVPQGGTGGGDAATARTNLGIGSMATRNLTVSSSAPSGGADGDVWFKV